MEPAPEERDDGGLASGNAPFSYPPQWSPLLKSGMTTAIWTLERDADVPQWSPLLKSGMTR